MSNTTQDQNALIQGRSFVWHELYVPDIEAAKKFYADALDFGTEAMDMGPMGQYHMFTRDGNAISGMMSTRDMQSEHIPPHWATYLGVDDVDARVAKVKEHGGSVVVEAMSVPGIGRMALVADPQGAHIWLFKGE
jgi:hypothetical protein